LTAKADLPNQADAGRDDEREKREPVADEELTAVGDRDGRIGE
jgi:hypothetical protein